MSEFPAYQTAPQYSGLVPSLVPSLRVRSVVVIVSLVLVVLDACAVTLAPLTGVDRQVLVILAGAAIPFSVLAGVAWMMWQYRARLNLQGFGVYNLQWAPGWSIGGWFIPLANIIVPILVLNEIDKATAARAAAADESGIGWGGKDTNRAIFMLWAIGWPLRGVVSYGALALASTTAAGSIALRLAVEIFAGAAAILLVLRITAGQEKIRRSRPAETIVSTPPPLLAGWPDATV